MNLVDSCGWLEYLADGVNAQFFADAIEDAGDLIVPSLSLYEVFRRIVQQRGEGDALQAVALMQQGRVVDLTSSVALSAARLSIDERLPMADAVMLATARAWEATLWTQDADFAEIAGVKYVAKTSGSAG
ncbi:MAG: type II toxin-antitoxin system VapC family toxin [Coriobacteriia bacterium]|nr:type II toxin-antitoxin system VapC family toxin [Coriobacteriia bacterium]